MSAPAPSLPVFPGGRDTAPEATAAGCAHEPCLCHVGPGKHYCSLACARGQAGDDLCRCGHFGCTGHAS